MTQKYIFAIDLGGTSTKLAFLQENGEIFQQWEIPTDISEQGRYIVPNIQISYEKKLQELGLNHSQILGVGMGAPGPINSEGVVSEAVNLGWQNFPLQQTLKNTFKLPAFVGNDANCAALGEMWMGAGQGVKNMIFITLGTGVGGGIIVNGNVIIGAQGGAGEIGHITVQLEDGYPCNCGKTGCLETVASATGVVRLAEDQLIDSKDSLLTKIKEEQGKITAKDVFDAAKKADAFALNIVDQVSFYLGFAIANLCATLNPNVVVIGGGVSKAGKILIDTVEKYYNQFAFPPTRQDTNIRLANLGNNAGLFGAGWLVKDNVR